MQDVRIGVALEAEIDRKLVEICQKHSGANKPLSKGDFLSAMVTMLPEDVRDQAIAAFKAQREAEKEQRRLAKKELQKKVRSLTPEEIEAILAARQAA